MTYVFDTSPLSALFRNFYRGRFPSLWVRFDAIVEDGRLVSVREALREINDGPVESLRDWADDHPDLFPAPTPEEANFVTTIYGIKHFQQNIEQQKLLKGGRNADPFIIAPAAVEARTVVTLEQPRPNSAKIPNICNHFGVPWVSLEQFMEAEDWEF